MLTGKEAHKAASYLKIVKDNAFFIEQKVLFAASASPDNFRVALDRTYGTMVEEKA